MLFSLGFLSSGPQVVRTIGTFRFMGPTVTRSSVVPDLGISTGVGIESTDEDSGSFLFFAGGRGVYGWPALCFVLGGCEQTPVYLVCPLDIQLKRYYDKYQN